MKCTTGGVRRTGRARMALVGFATLLGLAVLLPGWAAGAPGPTDLTLTKSDSADPVVDETNFTYTLQVANTGINDATGVSVTDTLPSQVAYVSSSATLGSCSRNKQEVTCALGQVDAATTATIAIVVKAKREGTASNTATLTSVDDTLATNNTDTETTVISKKPSTKKPKKPKGKKATCAAPTITGTAGPDTLVGTNGPDVIRGFSGSDLIFGNGGSDLICADRGNDKVFGGPKNDTIIGASGRDSLIGGTGGDHLKGKSGRDKLRGQRGNDTLDGGRQRDNCKGGAGRDGLIRCP